ncbi:MAG: HAMP domain-containing sensor histidine kinase, partial [bacterium]
MKKGSEKKPTKLTSGAKKLQAKIRALENKSRLLEREKDAFISIISHELRTPLAVIKGYLDLAADGLFGEIPAALKEPILKSRENADRLHRLIENLLEISRLEAGQLPLKWKSISIHALVSGALMEIEEDMKSKSLTMNIKLDDDLPLILADEEKVKRVLLNLLQNAIRHSPVRGRILVESGRWDPHRKKASPSGFIYMSVADEGSGITSAMRRK